MKKHHLFAYSCTLLLPIGVLAGAGVGSTVGLPIAMTFLGIAAGCIGSHALARAAATNSTRQEFEIHAP